MTEIDARDAVLQEQNEARAETFSEEFDDWINGPSELPFDLGSTPAVLQKLGVEEKKVEIYVEDVNHMKKHTEMTDSVLWQAPSVVHTPILVKKSRTVPDRLTVFGELFDKNNNPVLVIFDLEPNAAKGFNPNAIRILNAYGKDKDPQWFIDHSRILYIDPNEERTHNWRLLSGLQLPSSANNGFIHMVTRAENTVNNGVKDDGKTEFSSTNVVDPKSIGEKINPDDVKYSENDVGMQNKKRSSCDTGGIA